MKPTYLALLFFLCFSAEGFGQTDIETRRIEVHRNPAAYAVLDSTCDWLDCYSSSLGFYLEGEYDSARVQLRSLNFNEIPIESLGYPLLLQGRILRSYGQSNEALISLDSATAVFLHNKDEAGLFFAQIDLIEHFRASETFDEAKAYIRQLKLQVNDPNIPIEFQSRLYHREAAYRIEVNDSINLAEDLLYKSIELARTANAPWQEATALRDLGYFKTLKGDEESLDVIERASEIWDSLGYQLDYSIAQINKSRILNDLLERYEESEEILNDVFEIAEEKNWTILKSYVWRERAYLRANQERWQEALEAYMAFHEFRTTHLREQYMFVNSEIMAQLGVQVAREQLERTAVQKSQTERAYLLEKSRSQVYIILAVVSLAAMIFLGWFYLRTRRLNHTLALQRNLTADVNEKLETALEQKDFLYRELHHRVKNNLANLSGLIYLQERSIQSEDAKSALMDTRNRIQAMSAIHKGLYQTDDIIHIQLQSYLEELTMSLISMYDDVHGLVEWDIECGEFELNIDVAVPLAMVINEILTNSLKYAFKDAAKGKLVIKGIKKENGDWTITVSDNGPGLPDELDLKKSNTLGVSLIHSLTEDLGVTVEYNKTKEFSTYTLSYTEVNP